MVSASRWAPSLKKITPPRAQVASAGTKDFSWEREWRFPASQGRFKFTIQDVFIGLCPDEEIRYFEREFRPLKFIDPRRPTEWYATRLINARDRLGLEYSVV